MRTFVSIFF